MSPLPPFADILQHELGHKTTRAKRQLVFWSSESALPCPRGEKWFQADAAKRQEALNIFLVQLESDKAELAVPRLYKASHNQPPLHTPTHCQYADLQLILQSKSRQAAAWGLRASCVVTFLILG